MTAEQGCEGRDEFTNGSPRDQWVGGKEVGRGEWVTVHTRKGGRGGGSGGYQGLARVNYPQCSQDSPSTSLPFVVMSKTSCLMEKSTTDHC